MVNIFPFQGITYNKKKVKKIANVMTPPYDVISEDEQNEYYEQNNFNLIRLILGKEFKDDSQYNNKYLRAAAFLKGWQHHNILTQDEKPAIYFYEQRFSVGSKKYARQGFVALLRLEDFGHGKVYPHENTLSKPKKDRIELLRACSANLENIFTIYSDEKLKTLKPFKKFTRRKPLFEVKDKNKVTHRIWKVEAKNVILKIMKEMKDKPVFIADGHHRYEASLKYRNEMKNRNTRFSEDESYNHIMAFFTPIESEGLVVLPIHRMIKVASNFDFQGFFEELGIYFEIKEFPYKKRTEKNIRKKALKELASNKGKKEHMFLLSIKDSNKYLLLKLREDINIEEMLKEDKSDAYKNLDVTILQTIVISKILGMTANDISYSKDKDDALDKVLNNKFDIAILLNPTKVEDVMEIAKTLEKMPQKSTFFYPKLLSGLIMNKIEFNERIAYDEKTLD